MYQLSYNTFEIVSEFSVAKSFEMEKWSGKLAVVTGASSGIGAAITRDFAKAGVNVIALARRVEKLEELATELKSCPGKVYSHHCDVSEKSSIEETFKWIEETHGPINILVNNAGIYKMLSILDEGEEVDEYLTKVVETNLNGVVRCTKLAFKLMQKSDDYGYIININSIGGHRVPLPSGPKALGNVYQPTKHAVTALTEIFRQELMCQKNMKIRVSSVSPGLTKTEIVDGPIADHIFSTRSYIRDADISSAVMYVLSTPYDVNVTELTVQPINEWF